MTQKAIAQLFDVQVPTIAKRLKNIYDEEELERDATLSKKKIVQTEGSREIRASERHVCDSLLLLELISVSLGL